jgi:sulfate adenylyltransferase
VRDVIDPVDDAVALTDIDGIPRVVLDDDGLDVLELALSIDSSWLPSHGSMPQATGPVLTDAENTPLAIIQGAGASGPPIRPLRPLPRGAGPHWDPTLRRSVADVSAELRRTIAAGRVGPVLAIVIDDVPTLADQDTALDAVRSADPVAVLCVIPVARRAREPGQVGWAGMTRAGRALADHLAAAIDIPVLPLVLPWSDGLAGAVGSEPGAGHSAPTLDAALAAHGATTTVRLGDRRQAGERERIASLDRAFQREVLAIYPAASAAEVLKAHLPPGPAGAVVLFTGLSGSGKSTIARALADELRDACNQRITLLDGDEVRTSLSADLSFDVAGREANIDRIAFVSALVADHGGIVLAAPIAPFDASRRRARERVRPPAVFLLVHVKAPLDVCEARDRKGLYARARRGEIADFTGISSPYEEPLDADVVIDTTITSAADGARRVRDALEERLAAAGS